MRVARPWVAVIAALIGGLVGTREAAACLWVTGTTLGGESVETDPPRSYVEFLLEDGHAERRTAELGAAPGADAPPLERSDHAVDLILHGRVREAIVLLEAVEAAHPGEYAVAANLGTAYELDGDDRAALRWISEGMRRNSDSHAGTEWLHVRILEAKLALAADPDWLRTHTVLGADIGDDARPRVPASWPDGRTTLQVVKALEYQLHERLSLVAPPDVVVHDLLFDLGNLLAGTRSVEHAIAVHELALRYGDLRAGVIATRRELFETLREEARRRRQLEDMLVLAAVATGLAILVTLTVVLVRRRRRRRREGLPRAVVRP